MTVKQVSPRFPANCETVLQALQHSLSATRLCHMAQIHARAETGNSLEKMAEATDKMIDALDSLHATLQSLALAVLPRDVDLSRHDSKAWQIANGFHPANSRR